MKMSLDVNAIWLSLGRLKSSILNGKEKHPATVFVSRHMILTVIIFVFNPFGLEDYTEQYTQDMIARFAAPFYDSSYDNSYISAYVSPYVTPYVTPYHKKTEKKGQSGIVVIQINDQVLRELNLSWPMSYHQHSKLLRRILSYQPKAIFVDFLYSQDRDPAGLKSLKRMLQKYNDPNGKSPIYIADMIDNQRSVLLPELQQDVLRAQVNWSHFEGQYPLTIRESGVTRETPATSLFKRYCQEADCGDIQWLAEPPPITVAWGARVDPIIAYVTGDSQGCRTYDPGFTGSLLEGLRLLSKHMIFGFYDNQDFDQQVRQRCLYSRFLFANQLAPRTDTATTLIKGNIVLLGGIFNGIPDYITSPVHGKVPGVFLHAMALDNLITRGEGYTQTPDAIFSFNNFSWADLIELIVMATILMIIAKAIQLKMLSFVWQRLALFALITLANLTIALAMNIFLHYPPVNALAMLVLTILALTLTKTEEVKTVTTSTNGE